MARKTASDFFDSHETDIVEKVEAKIKNETKSKDKPEKNDHKELYEQKEKIKQTDSEEPLEPANKETSETTVNGSNSPSASDVNGHQEQYMQYMMQYQQYYAQYYSQYYAQPSNPVVSDPAYEYYTNTTAATSAAPSVSFDATRANNQMNAYFDPNKFQTVLSPEMQAAQRTLKEQQQSRLTAKEIEAFKKKKIEKKKAKNRWFYE